MKLFNFSQFITESRVNEAQIKDKAILAQLDDIYELKQKAAELKAELKRVEDTLKEFDTDIRPIFNAMKVLQDKLATTERYTLKITRYGGEGTSIAYAKVVEQALTMVDDAAKAIIEQCITQHKNITEVKHSFEIERVNEAKFSEKAKAAMSKISAKINSIVSKFKSFFDSKIAKIDSANAKLAKLVK